MQAEEDKPEYRMSLDELLETLEEWRSLIRYLGWVRLANVFNDQIKQRIDEAVLVRHSSIDEIVASEFPRGEAAGMRFVLEFPQMQIDVLEEEISRRQKLEEEEKSNAEELREAGVRPGSTSLEPPGRTDTSAYYRSLGRNDERDDDKRRSPDEPDTSDLDDHDHDRG